MCGGDEGKEKSIGELNGEKGLAVVVFISFQRQPPITDPSHTNIHLPSCGYRIVSY